LLVTAVTKPSTYTDRTYSSIIVAFIIFTIWRTRCITIITEPPRFAKKTTNICKKYNYCWHPYEYCNCSATWDDESNEIISDSNRYQNCESFGVDSVCDFCKPGWFGDYCDTPCSPYCKNHQHNNYCKDNTHL
jgi:hypothetical protein